MIKKMVLCLFLLVFSENAAAAVTASVNRTSVPVGEVFILTISADGNISGQPDLSVLNDDFNVYSTSVSHQSYFINGQSSSTTEWQIGLAALNVGKQKIPAVSIGSEKTNTVEIDIVASNITTASIENKAVQTQGGYELRGRIVAEPNPYYVQQALFYNVELIDAGGLKGGEPIFENDANDWLIIGLGQPEVSTQVVNNVQRRVITYKYALFPQKSGHQTTPAVRFEGYARGKESTLNLGGFGMIRMSGLFDIEEPVSLRASGQEIEVSGVPAEYGNKWWIPAEEVRLSAQWKDAPQIFRQGEAATRLIKLEAIGVTAGQLPDIKYPSSQSFKQYPEVGNSKSSVFDGKVAGEKTFSNIYVPEISGEVELPEIAVEWFNVHTNTVERAVLPAQKIYVERNLALEITDQKQSEEYQDDKMLRESSLIENIETQPKNRMNMTYLTALGAFLAGVLLSFLIFRHRGLSNSKPQCETRQYPDFIIEKAYQNDFRSLRDALVSWATGYYSKYRISNLKDVAAAVDDAAFGEQIDIIIEKLYNEKSTRLFNPKVFADIYKKALKKQKKTVKNKKPLPSLYD